MPSNIRYQHCDGSNAPFRSTRVGSKLISASALSCFLTAPSWWWHSCGSTVAPLRQPVICSGICFCCKHSDREVAFDPKILLACASSHGTLIHRTRDERKILIMRLNLKFGNAETYLLVLGSSWDRWLRTRALNLIIKNDRSNMTYQYPKILVTYRWMNYGTRGFIMGELWDKMARQFRQCVVTACSSTAVHVPSVCRYWLQHAAAVLPLAEHHA